MKMTFRWFGKEDTIGLEKIRQIPGMSGVVTALYSKPAGEVWDENEIAELKQFVEASGLTMEVIESVPVHEDIKLGTGQCERYIENYKENIRRLAKYGVKCICYNFMPIFDWTRSDIHHRLADGSEALVYYQKEIAQMDPTKLSLPGWDASYQPEEVAGLIAQYQALGEEGLWHNLEHFLKEIIPVAHACDVKMAIHPDDPCWPIFGIPRIITNQKNIDRFLKLVDDPYNGLTLCTGSLGCSKENDCVAMAKRYASMGRVHFVHLRNVLLLADGSFEESAHLSACGSLDMVAILKELYKAKFKGYIRPDHGRMIWNEEGKPGYGLYDRALGAAYITGIWETLTKMVHR